MKNFKIKLKIAKKLLWALGILLFSQNASAIVCTGEDFKANLFLGKEMNLLDLEAERSLRASRLTIRYDGVDIHYNFVISLEVENDGAYEYNWSIYYLPSTEGPLKYIGGGSFSPDAIDGGGIYFLLPDNYKKKRCLPKRL